MKDETVKRTMRVYADTSVFGGVFYELCGGFGAIAIHTPPEVVFYDDEDERF